MPPGAVVARVEWGRSCSNSDRERESDRQCGRQAVREGEASRTLPCLCHAARKMNLSLPLTLFPFSSLPSSVTRLTVIPKHTRSSPTAFDYGCSCIRKFLLPSPYPSCDSVGVCEDAGTRHVPFLSCRPVCSCYRSACLTHSIACTSCLLLPLLSSPFRGPGTGLQSPSAQSLSFTSHGHQIT